MPKYNIDDLYSVSGMAIKKEFEKQYNRHIVTTVPAKNRYEALGKATVIVYKAYPAEDGWLYHHVVVQCCNMISDPEAPNFERDFNVTSL